MVVSPIWGWFHHNQKIDALPRASTAAKHTSSERPNPCTAVSILQLHSTMVNWHVHMLHTYSDGRGHIVHVIKQQTYTSPDSLCVPHNQQCTPTKSLHEHDCVPTLWVLSTSQSLLPSSSGKTTERQVKRKPYLGTFGIPVCSRNLPCWKRSGNRGPVLLVVQK